MEGKGVEEQLEVLRLEREEKLKQIAEKRRQVEELRRRRAERSERATQGSARGPDAKKALADLGPNVENLVQEILGDPGGQAALKASPEGPLRELANQRRGSKLSGAKAMQLQTELGVTSVAFDPHEQNSYERSVQTDEVQMEAVGEEVPHIDQSKRNSVSVLTKMALRSQKAVSRHDAVAARPGMGRKVQPEGTPDREAIAEATGTTPRPTQELSAEERASIMKQPDFRDFFDRATLLVERVLGQDSFDVSADFVGDGIGEGGGDDERDLMHYVDDYDEDRWTLGRPVTDVRFSPHRPEIFLAAYGQRSNPTLSDPDGCMLVWNLAMRQRPELSFTCQSAVLTAHFHKFNPALFFGGTYAGGVVLWDARAKGGPVQRTPLSGKGHSHPVQAMQQVGTQNATNLVTASNDGRLCLWSLAMLVLPQETIDLKNESKNRRELAVTSLSFPENETNILYVGAEDGSVCQVHIHGSKVGATEVYDGHDGPVSGLDMHPRGDATQLGADSTSDLALSSSFDWSVKLWMVKQYQSPVLSLDSFEDYVYDVRWHPTHPAVFSTVDGEGCVDLWNLNRNLESPVARCEHPSRGKLALNHCHWSNDGRRLVAGDSEGTLSVYGVDRSIVQPRNEDYQLFQERLRQLQPIAPRVGRDALLGGLDPSRYGARGYGPGGSGMLDARH